jgi:DNA-binding Xre family transcriptional regulator
MLYRASLNPEARAIIVGYATEEAATLRPYIETLGIEVVYWRDEVGMGVWGVEEEVPAALPTPIPASSSSLCWHVAEHAQSRGITSVRELSFAMHTNRQSLYPIWQGRAKSISLAILGRLYQTLASEPGGWFRWDGDDLVWNIREVAEAHGLNMQHLVWASAIFPHSLMPIWRGVQQFVFVETLSKLARALDLDPGDLFEWKEMGDED